MARQPTGSRVHPLAAAVVGVLAVYAVILIAKAGYLTGEALHQAFPN